MAAAAAIPSFIALSSWQPRLKLRGDAAYMRDSRHIDSGTARIVTGQSASRFIGRNEPIGVRVMSSAGLIFKVTIAVPVLVGAFSLLSQP